MNIKILTLSAMFTLGLAFTGCEKEENGSATPQIEQTNLNDKSKSVYLKSEITYIEAETFEEDFEIYMTNVFNENDATMLFTVEFDIPSETYAVTHEPVSGNPSGPNILERVVCRSNDLSAVLKCRNNYIQHSLLHGGCDFSWPYITGNNPPVAYNVDMDC